MTIPKSMNPQKDFSAGQINASAVRRDDLDQVRAGAKIMCDFDWLGSNGLTRRRGSTKKSDKSGKVVVMSPAAGELHTIVLGDGKFTVINTLTDAVIQTVTGCPWNATQIYEMDRDWWDNRIVVAHQSFAPQVLTYSSGSWSRVDFAFADDVNGGFRMPFFRFADTGITLLPSARTGTGITVTASASVFVPGHVGVVFTYGDRQFEVTGYTSAVEVTADVKQELPPTHRVTVQLTSIPGFQIGDVVEGATSGAKGIIAAIGTPTADDLQVVLIENIGRFRTSENIVGPTGNSTVSANSVEDTIQALTVWEEQFMSDHRGWPGAVTRDRRRLIFSNFAQKPGAVLWGAIDAIDDFLITGDAEGAILEFVPDEGEVRSVTGGPDQFVLTDESAYYIPISASNPLKAGSVEFKLIGAGGASSVRPVQTNQGLAYVTQDGAGINVLAPTGQTAAPYRIQDITRYHVGLINDAIEIAASTGNVDTPGDHLYIVNSDGTMVLGRYDPENNWAGFQPWNSVWEAKSVAVNANRILLTLEKDFGNGTVSRLAELSKNAILDAEELVASPSALIPSLAGATVTIRSDNPIYGGSGVVGSLGELPLTSGPNANIYVGTAVTPQIEPFLPNFQGGEDFGQRKRRRKVGKAAITVRNSQGFVFEKNSRQKRVPAYFAGEDQSQLPPKRDDTYTFRCLGREFDPELSFKQDHPGSWEILEVGMEVTA